MAEKTRYFIQLSFKGTNYHGWQEQENANTVQAELNKALHTLTRENIETLGAGRTDAGVHASYYIAHFESIMPNIEKNEKFIHQLNSILPLDIAVQKISKVKPEAHARFDAISRTYEYHIVTEKNPYNTELAYFLRGKLNIEKMNAAATILFEYDDFESFCKLHSDNKTTICKIIQANWQYNNGKYVFTIKADRFLRNMVRAIVGTLLEIGKEKMTLDEFRKIIELKNRSHTSTSAPAKGLFFTYVEYPDSIYVND